VLLQFRWYYYFRLNKEKEAFWRHVILVNVFDIFLMLYCLSVFYEFNYVNYFCSFLSGIDYHLFPLLNTVIMLLNMSAIFC
jgi:hypothetical protein